MPKFHKAVCALPGVAYSGAAVGHTYRFYSAARDHVGHVEAPPTDPDDGTIIPDAVTAVRFRFGDLDGDGVVDLVDFKQLSDCLTGPGGSLLTACEAKDLDLDDDVDLADFASFQEVFTGSP